MSQYMIQTVTLITAECLINWTALLSKCTYTQICASDSECYSLHRSIANLQPDKQLATLAINY